jgi:hypothetical protein
MNKSKFYHQTKTRVPREAVLSSILAFIGIFAKFSYVLVMKDAGRYAIAEMFGYRYLSQFLWSLGNEVFAVSIGIILFVASKFIVSTTPIKKVFRGLSFVIMFAGLYFMGWIFFQNVFEEYTEILVAFVFALFTTTLLIPFLMYLTREIRSVQELKSSVIAFFVEIRNVHFRNLLKNAHKLEFLDDYNIEAEAREELKQSLRKERKQINDDFDKRLHDETYDMDS